jgi:N-acetylmuramoyl-L-alanine amidase
MKFNISAGHGPDGKVACGAVGLIKESTEARKVKDKVIQYLRKAGHTAYDCTCENGTSKNDVLKKIVSKCNSNDVDLDVSIHFNSGANDKKGNDKSTGVEVLIYSNKSKAKDEAQRICNKLAKLGFRNRGVKVRNDLYYLKHTKASSLLIETAFVDDKDDVDIYLDNVDKIAKSIAEALTNTTITSSTTSTNKTTTTATYTNIDFIKDVQRAIGAKVDGKAGAETLSKTVTVSATKNRTHRVVRPLQKRLNILGYGCGAEDGIAGAKFKKAVVKFQKSKSCIADGEITAKGKTWKKLLGM